MHGGRQVAEGREMMDPGAEERETMTEAEFPLGEMDEVQDRELHI